MEAEFSEVRLGINPSLDYKDAFILHLHIYSGILFILRDQTEHLTSCNWLLTTTSEPNSFSVSI